MWVLFSIVVLIKMVLMFCFSSDYQDHLFMPFVRHFLSAGGNPWEYFYTHPQEGVEFPYSPLMLGLLSVFYAPVHFLGISSAPLLNFFFKLPTLAADLAVAFLLCRIFDWQKVLLYYFASPIIIYACYMHSHIDLIPSALLFIATYLLTRNKAAWAAVCLGLAAATKLHVMAAYPLMVIYTLKNFSWRKTLFMAVIPWLVWGMIAAPVWGEGFRHLVLDNPQQKYVFDVFFPVGHLKIYLPLLAVFVIYLRFMVFRKINLDLFFTFLAIVFAVFVSLTIAPPGWYVWLFPFLSIFFIKYHDRSPLMLKMHIGLGLVYLIYMVFFYTPEHVDLRFLGQAVDWKIYSDQWRNVSFTFLVGMLAVVMYAFYKFGIKSNFYYIQDAPLFIGIAGDSAVGKSTLLGDLKGLLANKVLEYEGDGAHRWEREDKNWEKFTHLNPKANFLHQQFEQLHHLKNGRRITRSDYDHQTGKFSSPANMAPSEYIVISGLHTFYLPKMRRLIDLKVYLDTDERLRRHWKIVRDVTHRGKSKHEVMEQIQQRLDDAKKYIYPQRDLADIVVRYMPAQDFMVGDDQGQVPLKLSVTLDSNVELLPLIHMLEKEINIVWDYAQDMRTQTLEVTGHISAQLVARCAQKLIFNCDELLSPYTVWQDDYRGFVQLMILFVLSEKMKDAGNLHVIG